MSKFVKVDQWLLMQAGGYADKIETKLSTLSLFEVTMLVEFI